MDIQEDPEAAILAQAMAEFRADTGAEAPKAEAKEPDEPPAGGEKEPEAKAEEDIKEDKEPDPDKALEVKDLDTAKKEIERLNKRLESKDKGYEQKAPAIKTGEMLLAAIDPKNPRHAEGVAEVKRLIGLEDKTETTETKVEASDFKDPDFPDDEDGNYAKEFYEQNVKPLVAHATQGLKAELAALKTELAGLKGSVEEPLTLFKSSKQEAEFDQTVERECAKALDLYEVREHGKKATEADFRAAMKKGYTEDGRPMEPVKALQVYMLGKPPKETKKEESGKPPRMPRSTESRSAPGINPDEDMDGYTRQFLQAETDSLQKTG